MRAAALAVLLTLNAPALAQTANKASDKPVGPNLKVPVTASNYRQLAADAAYGMNGINLDGAQVSELRVSAPPQMGDRYTCIRTATAPVAHFAVLFFDGKEPLVRRAVAIDNCAVGGFSPLPAARAREAVEPRRVGTGRAFGLKTR